MAFHSAKVASAVMISRGIKVFTNLQRLVYQHSDGDAKETIKRSSGNRLPFSFLLLFSPHTHANFGVSYRLCSTQFSRTLYSRISMGITKIAEYIMQTNATKA